MKTASVSKNPPAIPNKAFTLCSLNLPFKENAGRWIWFQEVRWAECAGKKECLLMRRRRHPTAALAAAFLGDGLDASGFEGSADRNLPFTKPSVTAPWSLAL
ncbi:hypothetical protein [Mesorhizobium sp. P5_C1]